MLRIYVRHVHQKEGLVLPVCVCLCVTVIQVNLVLNACGHQTIRYPVSPFSPLASSLLQIGHRIGHHRTLCDDACVTLPHQTTGSRVYRTHNTPGGW